MKYRYLCLVLLGLVLGQVSPASAVTVYFKDGTQVEVEKVTRIGNSVCLFVDISKIDTTKTLIDELPGKEMTLPKGLAVVNVEFSPSEDNAEIIATGNVVNNSEYPVQHVRVTAILMDKNDHVLLRVQSYVRPEKLLPGQTGTYRFQVKKPQGFWKASVEVQGEAVE